VAPVAAAPLANGLELSTGMEENMNPQAKAAVIVPNPFGSELSAYVSMKKPGKLTLTLTDLSGRTIQSVNGTYGLGETQVKMNAGKLSNGVYLLRIQGENMNITQKVIKR
jgi:hypothetical protein